MKVGVVGPSDIVDKMHISIKKEYPNTEILNLVYNVYTETPAIVNKCQREVDALLFGGKTPFSFSIKYITPIIPWGYVPRNSGTLLRSLLEASIIKKYDITNISIDTYETDILYEIYEEIGFDKKDLKIRVADQKISDDDYASYLFNFHKYNYYHNRSSCCITGLTDVYQQMCNHSIPCVRIVSPEEVILEAFSQVQLKHMIQLNQNSQIVCVAISIDLLEKHFIIANDEYKYLLDKNKITHIIVLFASKIQAAISEGLNKEYLLFTTRKIIETETSDYQDMYFMDMVEETTFYTISVGVGYGETANQAKKNAADGMNRAIDSGGNTAFVIYDENKIRRVLRNHIEPKGNMDKLLNNISKKTRISTNVLYKIYCAIEMNGLNTFTASELSILCDINYRSMNRIIQKLEASGFCKIVGNKMLGSRGRPARILKLKYF